ncbi:carotenoid 1,2-hydratase [Thiorhodococcus mannitoliphagus]|uniref:Carotenoid 1,2-hydratase n=1 Tax=Thiorhodococcus mannitoliphagus TaxID=329406 RepID=A0A6P1DXT5_9GAMM|nr:carotenoid 1,2-hydratase [Thiorhodococcus mannitoliphagus]NEX22290.1 carotenoid 1,2-hydratase [Thiorhodococcus mannitoliphagus]
MKHRRRDALQTILAAALCLGLTLLGGAAAKDFAPVLEGHRLAFPEDNGAHPKYRTEWWYITGWLTDAEGHDRGFQVTFFRVGTGLGADNPSRFAPRQLILAHAAIADPATGHLLHAERAERALDPLSGASVGNTHVWIDDWSLSQENGVYQTTIHSASFDLELTLTPPGPPQLNGRDGFSQKTPDPANASDYYSRPQLAVEGGLRLADQDLRVSGQAWLDHEWSSQILPETAQGWDWIGINLNDGGSLMAFRMRHRDGSTLWAGGTLRHGDEEAQILSPDQLHFEPGRRWQSPRTGAVYPVEWVIEIDGRQLTLSPLMDDQELDGRRSTGAVYWEGATRLLEDGQEIGRGYLEMTGYWRRQTGL